LKRSRTRGVRRLRRLILRRSLRRRRRRRRRDAARTNPPGDAQAASRQRHSAAFESIREALNGADRAVDVLEAIAVNTPGAPPEVLIKLRIARRVGPRVSAAPKAPPTTPADKAA